MVKTGWLKLSANQVLDWSKRKEYEALIFALKNGRFKVRALAAISLGKTKDVRVRQVLLPYIDDPVPLVSLAAMQALEQFALDQKILVRIKDKKKYWQKEMARKKEQQAKFSLRSNPHKFPSWKQEEKMPRLEEVRQMLKRPIRWG